MDDRLIFRYQFEIQTGGRFVDGEPALLEGRPARGRAFMIPKSLEAEPRKAPGRSDSRLPVLKLTQVGVMSILRRSRERSRRNSATWLRNFGIRSALEGVKALGGRSEKVLATVY